MAKMNKTILLILFVVFSVILVSGCQKQPQLVGNDSDIHGCKASAGYSWCEVKQKCIRQWEENCSASVQSNNSEDLTSADVLEIAKSGECPLQGNFTGRPFYDSDNNKWWITMDGVRSGCKAICAISEETRKAKIEWRCGGPVSAI